jgi:CRISPR/Cas system-associated endoribonuclease Cas2
VPSAAPFIEDLEKSSLTREDYMAFLSDHKNYFQQPKKEGELLFRGLIADVDFRREFSLYLREAVEVGSQSARLVQLAPALEEATIASTLAEMNNLTWFLRQDVQVLSESLRVIKNTTSQYITELEYAAEAVRNEATAKIKAQEEFINPQISKLNRDYNERIAEVARSFDVELERLEKLKAKNEKFIQTDEENIKLYQKEAKKQAQKKHLIYEKSWKDKISQTKKELSGLKKELKRIEKSVKNSNKQKNNQIGDLRLDLAAKIKLLRQPLVELESARDDKLLVFRQETEKLTTREKPVIEGLNRTIKIRESINNHFETLGIQGQLFKSPALFYVPFYIICYQAGLSNRYIFLPPSTANAIGFGTKLKGAVGMSKIKERFIPRFKAITALIEKVHVHVKKEALFEGKIRSLGEKNNLLNTVNIRENLFKGLVDLKRGGWLSDREYESLTATLTSA